MADLKSKVPALPSGLPRDLLPGTAHAWTPLRDSTLGLLLVAPFVALLGFWMALAIRRARQTDPLRTRREAHMRLASTISLIEKTTTPTERSTLLLRWQHDAAVLWQIPHAAPAAQAFAAPSGARDTDWAQLWTEADRALYGTQAELPADWPARARAALTTKRVPDFSPLGLFRPRNLFPFVAAVVLLAAFAAPESRAQSNTTDRSSGEAAYRRGDFSTAEKNWQQVVKQNPTDPIARHNLSLALAQQDRWAEAAAHAAAAFVQAPSEPAIRWQFTLACSKAGFAPAPLVRFLPPGPTEKLAAAASPGTWQWTIVLAAVLAATAGALLLVCGYRRKLGVLGWTGLGMLGSSLILGAIAAVSAATYGTAADENAVLVWRSGTLRSIPTEADNTQKTSPLPAGSLAVSGKPLLGWVQLTFDNGQTGWVRKEELIGLWK